MSNHERMARIDGIDLETGQFSMTLATEGEASDGHILSIKGGQIPERMPLQVSHINDPTFTLGSVTNPQKFLKDSPPRLRAIGNMELGGEGAHADIRRDLALMVDRGHVTGVSIRWDEVAGKSVRRVNLPSDHPHFVADDDVDSRKRYGMYFEEWRALEGSLVALQADKAAVIGRAEETDGEVQTFWRAVADDMKSYVEEDDDSRIAAFLAGLRIDAAGCREAGATHADLINAVVDDGDADIEAVELDGSIIFLPSAVAGQLRKRLEREVVTDLEVPELDPEPAAEVEADQPSPLTLNPEQVRTMLSAEAIENILATSLDQFHESFERNAKALLQSPRTGKAQR